MAAVRPEQRYVLPNFLQRANSDSFSTLKVEVLLVIEGVVLVGCFRHHRVTHHRIEQDRCQHELVEFEHHFVVEEGHVKDESDSARAIR